MNGKLLAIEAAVLIGLFRPVLLFVEFNHHIELSYQAIAHLYMGGLAGWWMAKEEGWAWNVFWLLVLVEVFCAAIGALT